jgi:general secretion pathway protein G
MKNIYKNLYRKLSPFISPLPPRSGFTLIEVILAIALIAVLSVLALYAINPFEQLGKANDSKKKSDLAQIQRALELYYNDFGAYPSSSGNFTILVNSAEVAWGGSWQPYMVKLPADPSGKKYIYYSPPSSNGQTYYLYASLQRGNKDQQTCNSGNACTSLDQSGFPPSIACGGTCDYGVSSSNVSP